MSQVKMYFPRSLYSRHGMMRMPTTPVMRAPCLKEMAEGRRLEMSLAGETTLAARLVVMVAMMTAMSARLTTTGELKRAMRTTGSQITSPKTIEVAPLTTMPMNASNAIEAGSAIACPRTWSRCVRANRVKSGMLSESVAQNPTIAVRLGQNSFPNDAVEAP